MSKYMRKAIRKAIDKVKLNNETLFYKIKKELVNKIDLLLFEQFHNVDDDTLLEIAQTHCVDILINNKYHADKIIEMRDIVHELYKRVTAKKEYIDLLTDTDREDY